MTRNMFTMLEMVLLAVYALTLYYAIFWLIAFSDYSPSGGTSLARLPKISVIIPAYNEEASLERAAKSVLALDYPKELLEVVIVNDGSIDNTLAVARRIRRSAANAVKIISQENSGKWKAMNVGIAASSGEFIACLDADSTVRLDALKKMLPYFADEMVAIVLPMLYVDAPKNLLQKVQWHEYVINMFYRKVAGFLNCIHVAPGPFSLYRKKTLTEVGGFREGFKTEDLEIVLRLQSRNYKIVQTTDAEAYTEAPSKISELYRQRLRWNLGSTLSILAYRGMLFNKKYGDFGVFQLPIIFLATFFAAAILVITLYLTFLQPLYEKFVQLKLINFDLLAYLSSWRLDFGLLDIDFFRIFVSVSFFTISVLILVMSHKAIKRRTTEFGLPTLAVFLFFYYLFLGYVRLIVIRDLVFKRKSKW